MTDAATRATRRYGELLRSHLGNTRQAFEQVVSRPEMVMNGEVMFSRLTPLFITKGTYEAACGTAELVTKALLGVLRHVAEPEISAALALPTMSPRSQLLLSVAAPPIVSRVDILWSDGSEPQPLEINPVSGARFPGAILENERVSRALLDTAAMKELGRELTLVGTNGGTRLVAEMQRRKDEMGRSGPPVIAAILPTPGAARGDPAGGESRQAGTASGTSTRLLALMAFLIESGVEVRMCLPDELREEDGRLLHDRTEIDFLFGMTSCLARLDDDAPLLRAVLAGKVVPLDGFPTGEVLRGKELFALLSDPRWSRLFDEADVETLHRVVPWTRLLRDESTTFGAEVVNLEAFARANRELLVVKPVAESGGAGVALGWEMDEKDWNAAIDGALRKPHVVQRRVVGGRGHFERVQDGQLSADELTFDLDPYVWSGTRAEGCLARGAPRSLLNVTSGGSLLPVFVVS